MGLFGKKRKKATEEAGYEAQHAQQAAAQYGYGYPQPGPGPGTTATQPPATAHAGDPAPAAGPSDVPLPPDSPVWQPIGGVALDTYAQIAKYCATNGIRDEQTMAACAEYYWHIPAQHFLAGVNGWVDRMRQYQAVGYRFRQVYDAS